MGSRRTRNWVVGCVAFAGSSYGLYRLWQSPSVCRKRHTFLRVLHSLVTVTEAASVSAETLFLLSEGLNTFLKSDSDELPARLRQFLKMARSDEVQETVARVLSEPSAGICRGFEGFTGPVMDKLCSTADTGFASVVLGSFARNLVESFFDKYRTLETPATDVLVGFLCNERAKTVIAHCIQVFVATAVSVYLDKTMDISVCDELRSALANPKHQTRMKGLLVSVISQAVQSFITTSYDVLTSRPKKDLSEDQSCKLFGPKDAGEGVSGMEVKPKVMGLCNLVPDISISSEATWPESNLPEAAIASSYLAFPHNFMAWMQLSSKITFSALQCFVENVLCKFLQTWTGAVPYFCIQPLHGALEMVRYVSIKSISAVSVLCAGCLHAFPGVGLLEVVY